MEDTTERQTDMLPQCSLKARRSFAELRWLVGIEGDCPFEARAGVLQALDGVKRDRSQKVDMRETRRTSKHILTGKAWQREI